MFINFKILIGIYYKVKTFNFELKNLDFREFDKTSSKTVNQNQLDGIGFE